MNDKLRKKLQALPDLEKLLDSDLDPQAKIDALVEAYYQELLSSKTVASEHLTLRKQNDEAVHLKESLISQINYGTQYKTRYDNIVKEIKGNYNEIVKKAKEMKENETNRRNDIAKTYKENFVQIESKLRESNNETLKLIQDNKKMKEQIAMIEDLLRAKQIDGKVLKGNMAEMGFKVDNEHKVQCSNYSNKHKKLLEALNKVKLIKQDFNKSLDENKEIVSFCSKNDLVNKMDLVENQEQEITEMNKELQELKDQIDKITSERDSLKQKCKELQSKKK